MEDGGQNVNVEEEDKIKQYVQCECNVMSSTYIYNEITTMLWLVVAVQTSIGWLPVNDRRNDVLTSWRTVRETVQYSANRCSL